MEQRVVFDEPKPLNLIPNLLALSWGDARLLGPLGKGFLGKGGTAVVPVGFEICR